MKETVERYTSAWNQKTAEEVKTAFLQILSEEITYQDRQTPLITGIDAFVDLVMSSHEKVPGRRFSLPGEPEYFNQHCYYAWTIDIPGVGQFEGKDYVQYNDENKMTVIVGFVPNL
ncbi:nuclear transport factor 2 family protein [Pedobacter sp. AW1-32]|uniref:nuclear transport factor 2 family protein n=1 Tax=Pedobacter sp. AW1-32 TaxID=3383026 RepID=UPI003FEDB7D5